MIPKRVVLDTNVCLDLFVFRDPRWAALDAALRNGAIEAVTRTDCRMEWLAVLQYEHLPLDEASRTKAASEFDAVIRCAEGSAPAAGVKLPLCSDKDDQKFLETALAEQAGVLITKDKALLKLARKMARAGLFRILPPQDWRLEE
ncbi:putative toxin-antitoxin system toxin component, PIN family [Noviherbaspirillum sp.]|uniref:putative toxin-antitoxin system toxin component, PIN family n=1 Tax=Noviherbaspirillum sp. TaxID=1926288 RepID=UPI002FE07E2D